MASPIHPRLTAIFLLSFLLPFLTTATTPFVSFLYPVAPKNTKLTFSIGDTLNATWTSNITHPTLVLWCRKPNNSQNPLTSIKGTGLTTNGSYLIQMDYAANAASDACHLQLQQPGGDSDPWVLVTSSARSTPTTWGLAAVKKTGSASKATAATATASSSSSGRPRAGSSSGLTAGAKAGIGIGVAVVVIGLALSVAFVIRRRRRKVSKEVISMPKQEGTYYQGQQQPQTYAQSQRYGEAELQGSDTMRESMAPSEIDGKVVTELPATSYPTVRHRP
jgi:hypothetical protein